MSRSPYVSTVRAKIGNELLMLQAVTILVFDEQERLLMVQSADSGLWMTVGGAIEPDEAPADAAVRECWEETGLLVEPTRILGVHGGPMYRMTYSNGDVVSYVTIVFEARRIDGEARPDGSETSAVRYVSRDDASALPMEVWTKELLAYAFDRKAAPYFARATWRPPRGP
jgi:8-oxo-dGTP pyrophosphatase MutT (NUDIX family)